MGQKNLHRTTKSKLITFSLKEKKKNTQQQKNTKKKARQHTTHLQQKAQASLLILTNI